MTEQLFQQVRRKLNITWDDEETDARVLEIMESVAPWLIHKLGIPDKEYDFSTPGTEHDLFKACCLYEWNHIPRDEFEENYKHTIKEVQDQYDVESYLKAKEEATDGEA